MTPELLNIRKSLNKAYLKVKPTRSQVETFKSELKELFSQVNDKETEEHHKNLISGFLKNTYYNPDHYINTKDRNDLVIHTGKDGKSPVGVIIETKKPGNTAEMPSKENFNVKAVHELLLYYLRERVKGKNLEIKYLVATDLYEWYIFNAQDFERIFYKNKKFISDYEKFEEKTLSGTTTDFFYKDIAKPFIEGSDAVLTATYLNLKDFEKFIRNEGKEDDKKLIGLFKIFSPEHLLKLSFSNDSNTLDKRFYNELLHIIGLEERKEKSKKLIGRKSESTRDSGSIIENAINILNYEDCLSGIEKPSEYGSDKEEQLYTIALELTITWINRILFLKLLEGQLVKYHKGDQSYKFLNAETIPDYDALNKLFFHVLAIKESERGNHVKEKFSRIPYLNSSLFEPSDLEHKTIRISNLEDDYKIPILNATVLKDSSGKKLSGEKVPLHYLFEFLDAYDFASEGSEEISEENKTLINASVLGLIFEKINGYKDGSFFTPGFITMYMARETIRRAVVQKFNDANGWKCENLDALYNKIDDKKEANEIINSLKVCDPAVGSGHFLVSVLNEIIAIKSELKILADSNNRLLKDYNIEVINDELVITDVEGDFFEYHPRNPESQRVQETLFQEKQTIIENCLFGIDINPNSVKICRLRLWIELLKNAYYKKDSGYKELETLPNIDINIKCGNSLISRYPLDANIKEALKKSKWKVNNYRDAIMSYRDAKTKEEKASMRRWIEEIKSDFETTIQLNDKRVKRLNKLNGDLTTLSTQTKLFELTKEQKSKYNADVKRVSEEIDKVSSELEEIKNNKIYENAFEWRFEFPEVLNDQGDFVGFDVVIGNPPYLTGSSFPELHQYLKFNFLVAEYQLDLYTFFIERSTQICKNNFYQSLITPNSWLKNMRMERTREFVLNNLDLIKINPNISRAFEEAQVDTLIVISRKSTDNPDFEIFTFSKSNEPEVKHFIDQDRFRQNEGFVFDVEVSPKIKSVLEKIKSNGKPLDSLFEITRGVNPYDKYQGQSAEIIANKVYHSTYKKDNSFLPELRGKHVFSLNYKWDNIHYISYGDWLAAPRDPKFFKGPRIIFREIISDRFICAAIEEDFIIDRSLYIAKPRFSKINIYKVLAILYSKLAIWVFKYSRNEFDDLFPKIRLDEFKKLLIPDKVNLSESLTIKIKNLMRALNNNEIESVIESEKDLDRLVYEEFNLDETDIDIIESTYR